MHSYFIDAAVSCSHKSSNQYVFTLILRLCWHAATSGRAYSAEGDHIYPVLHAAASPSYPIVTQSQRRCRGFIQTASSVQPLQRLASLRYEPCYPCTAWADDARAAVGRHMQLVELLLQLLLLLLLLLMQISEAVRLCREVGGFQHSSSCALMEGATRGCYNGAASRLATAAAAATVVVLVSTAGGAVSHLAQAGASYKQQQQQQIRRCH
jgi:hypothetical protein